MEETEPKVSTAGQVGACVAMALLLVWGLGLLDPLLAGLVR